MEEPHRSNRRRSLRRPVKAGVQATCHAGNAAARTNLALTLLEASQVGISLLLCARVERGEEVAVRLEAPGAKRPVERVGTVVWAADEGLAYRVGIQLRERLSFAELSDLTHLRF